MEIKKIGSRGTLFSFDDLGIITNVYVINAKNNVYIVDTYLGPDIMQEIDAFIAKEFGNKNKIIINTHNHWDHVWGNCLYEDKTIISHELCKKQMEQKGAEALEKYRQMEKGNVKLVYPNLTFTEKLCFEEDQIIIYYSPGHTIDELSIIDLKDRVLFVGDNLELPAPFIMWDNLNKYVETLEEYLKLDVDIIIGGHTKDMDQKLVESNLNYIKKVRSGDTKEFETEEYAEYHNANMKWIAENIKK